MNLLKKIIISIGVLVIATTSYAQEVLTLYNMKSLPQAMYQNPGKMPQTKINISLPVISSTSVGYTNNGFTLSDLIEKRGPNDSLYLTADNMLSKLKDTKNLLATSVATDIFGVGFRVKQNYYSFSARVKSDIALSYSKDMMVFLLKGNTAFLGKEANFELKANSSTYMEYGLGFTHLTKDEKLSYGVKVKLLSGIANVNTERAHISVSTDSLDYGMKTTPDILINSSLIDTGSIANDAVSKNIFGPNKGFGIDLGAEYKINDKFTVSASVIDLGFINWSGNVSNYRSNPNNPSFTFTGYDLKSFFNGSDLQPHLDSISDSLKNTFYPLKSTNSYSTKLNTKLFAGVTYQITNDLTAGLLLYGKFVNDNFYSGLAISLNEAVGKWLNVSGSCSIANGTSNFGLGASLNLLPVQIYAISDNIFALGQVDHTHNTNAHVGINLSFGRIKKGDKMKKDAGVLDTK
ncbi:DUF5723 family protein [Parasediminibacterium sp. JCM 36343]|uniref:DUF5723 family protein n=1 Tax=Parasediminibacterium sp. JCM 36343 TaxID=3374279 RepID=UPI003978500A